MELIKRKRRVQWSGDRGEGSIFFFEDVATGDKVSRNLYLSYRAQGKEILVSAKTEDLADAKRELKRLTRNRENAKEGKETLVTPKTERVTVSELLDANIKRAEAKGLESLESNMRYQTETLRALLGQVRAVDFRPEHVDAYVERRLRGEGTRHKKKVGKKAIKNELGILSAAFRNAVRRRQLHFAPFIEMPTGDDVDKVREQEIPLEEFPAILKAIADDDGRDYVEWMLLTATRPKGIGRLRWDWFDSKAWTLRVPSEKGGNAREFSIEGKERAVIERRIARRRLDCPFIFHAGGRQLDARRGRRFFYPALKACGFPTGRKGFTLYDTKSTAVGVLLDSGLSDTEAMDFSGHKTPSMLQRYRKKTAKRHGASVRKRDAYLKSLAESRKTDAERVTEFPKVSGG